MPCISIQTCLQVTLPSVSTSEQIDARYAILASLPLPCDIPDDSLTPILIPHPYTLHDFIATTSGVSHRIFTPSHQWFISSFIYSYCGPSKCLPVFSLTKSRISAGSEITAFSNNLPRPGALSERNTGTVLLLCSSAAPIRGSPRLTGGTQPTYLLGLTHPLVRKCPFGSMTPYYKTALECFYNKDGKWYYAGVYKSFRLEDLCINEWECLSTEVRLNAPVSDADITVSIHTSQTSQALIKETLSSRKNTSPQNIYETSQLYSAGALKVACVGLQCIGFNNTLYRSLLEHAALCTQTGKWRVSSGGFNVNVNTTGLGLASGSSASWLPANGPGSPVVSHSQASSVGVIGRPTGPGLLQYPSSPVMILQRGVQDYSAIPGGGFSGAV